MHIIQLHYKKNTGIHQHPSMHKPFTTRRRLHHTLSSYPCCIVLQIIHCKTTLNCILSQCNAECRHSTFKFLTNTMYNPLPTSRQQNSLWFWIKTMQQPTNIITIIHKRTLTSYRINPTRITIINLHNSLIPHNNINNMTTTTTYH
ncbi:hypothetical protein LOK49_Contig371G00001 [Camellia lanceoleosa]|nr:hypothetical protein LOK49_Contig371G00001 [Camellia lanceoleosa]